MSKPKKIQAEKVIGTKYEPTRTTITDKDAILYALGIGFSTDPLKEADFKYTYELSEQFQAFPTIGCVSHNLNAVSPLLEHPNMPNFSPFVILHAEQRIVFLCDKISPGVQYINESEIIDVADKGKMALMVIRINSYVENDGKKQLAFYNDFSLIFRGLGGFGYKGKGLNTPIPKTPETKPDYVLKAKSFPGQAFLYRLSGDINPLHVDPNIATSQKFEKPILHGLATYGIVARTITQELLNNEAGKIKSYNARFIGHVFPGEGYEIAVWKKDSSLLFLAYCEERKTKVLIGELELKPQAKL